ncbi:MAG: acetylornithine transaminase [Candidatus Kapabacteria bacterium]|nr:acetylornithine transaminase [Candidatus Kapabacteria bacterium]
MNTAEDTALIEREHNVIYQTYRRLPIVIDRAEGCRIYDTEGNSYLDMLSGIAVNALGHSHPRIIEAITVQAQKYLHVSNFFYQEPQVRLAELLCKQTGFAKVTFSNSGAEAWEAAMKLARKYGNACGKTGNIITFRGAFHGRTYGALSTMDKPLYKDGMGPFLPNTLVLDYNDSGALREAVDETTCAVGLEFIQGEGGISSVSAEFAQTLRELHERFGFALIADEVQAGTGRTGDFFGFEQSGVQPDIVTMAKGIGGGLPLGCLLANERFSTLWEKGQHGTTYGGNALACAAGIVVMEELQSGVMENARSTGEYLRSSLERIVADFPGDATEVRGRGLMLGLVLQGDATPLRDLLLAKRVISNVTATNVLRIIPPLILTRGEADEFIAALRGALTELTA